MVCLYQGLTTEPAHTAVDRASRLSLDDKQPSKLTLRELQDTLENLQMEWPAFLSCLPGNLNAQQNLETVVTLIDQCFASFGVLCAESAGRGATQ